MRSTARERLTLSIQRLTPTTTRLPTIWVWATPSPASRHVTTQWLTDCSLLKSLTREPAASGLVPHEGTAAEGVPLDPQRGRSPLLPPSHLEITYERSADGDRFVLGVGNYLLDGCVLYWDSRDGTWRIDG